MFQKVFHYYPDFLSDKKESKLLEEISGIEFHNFIFQGYTANRKVVAFGFDYLFNSRKLTIGEAISKEFTSID